MAPHTERVPMRVAYLVEARLGRSRSTGPHPVSSPGAFDVPVAEAGDHPVVGRVTRRLPGADATDAGIVGFPGGGDGDRAQTIVFRRAGEGLLCPVTEPGGTVPLRLDRVGAVEDAIRAAVGREPVRHEPNAPMGRDLRLAWTGHPALQHGGTRPWKSLDRDGCDLRGVTSDGHHAALSRAAAMLASCRVIDGELWRPCGPPMWAADRFQQTVKVQVVIPGLDGPLHADPEMRATGFVRSPYTSRPWGLAPCGIDPRAFGASLVDAGMDGEVIVPDGAPDHPAGHMAEEADAQRLDCLCGLMGHDLGGLAWTDVPEDGRTEVAAMERALRRHRAGTLGTAEAMALVAGPLRELAGMGGGSPAYRATVLRAARSWTAVEALAPARTATPDDPGMAAFRP